MIGPSQLSRWIYENGDIWQWDFHNARKLASFIKERNVDFRDDHIIHLWELGWIRADIVQGNLATGIEGVDIIERSEDGEFIYADNRQLGLVHVCRKMPENAVAIKPIGVIPLFHPFKYYVFWQIHRIIKLSICPYQILFPGRYHEILDKEIDFFYEWIKSESARNIINRWDEIAR